MPTHKHGQYIPLNWEFIVPDEYYVRGHVSPDEADAAMRAYYGDEMPPHGPWRHAYARYSMQCTWDGNSHVLIPYDEPGRGRFKITMCPREVIVSGQ